MSYSITCQNKLFHILLHQIISYYTISNHEYIHIYICVYTEVYIAGSTLQVQGQQQHSLSRDARSGRHNVKETRSQRWAETITQYQSRYHNDIQATTERHRTEPDRVHVYIYGEQTKKRSCMQLLRHAAVKTGKQVPPLEAIAAKHQPTAPTVVAAFALYFAKTIHGKKWMEHLFTIPVVYVKSFTSNHHVVHVQQGARIEIPTNRDREQDLPKTQKETASHLCWSCWSNALTWFQYTYNVPNQQVAVSTYLR